MQLSCKKMNYCHLLKNNGFTCTQSRIRLLEVLCKAEHALSENEIEERIAGKINKTTIYRNLASMAEKGMVEKIQLDDCIKYKLNLANGSVLKKNHIHFHCRECDKVLCLDDLVVKDYPLPEGFDKLENQFLIIGICKDCNELSHFE